MGTVIIIEVGSVITLPLGMSDGNDDADAAIASKRHRYHHVLAIQWVHVLTAERLSLARGLRTPHLGPPFGAHFGPPK